MVVDRLLEPTFFSRPTAVPVLKHILSTALSFSQAGPGGGSAQAASCLRSSELRTEPLSVRHRREANLPFNLKAGARLRLRCLSHVCFLSPLNPVFSARCFREFLRAGVSESPVKGGSPALPALPIQMGRCVL